MTEAERAIVVRWLIENVTSSEVPADEGNTEGLLWNLVNLAMHGHGYKRFDYHPDQERAVEAWQAGRLPFVVPAAVGELPPPFHSEWVGEVVGVNTSIPCEIVEAAVDRLERQSARPEADGIPRGHARETLHAEPGSLSLAELRGLAREHDTNSEVLGRVADEAIRRLEAIEDSRPADWEVES